MGKQSLIPPTGDLLQATIRPATAGDSPRLAVLCGQLWYPTSVAQVEQRLKQIQRDEQRCIYVAELADASPRSGAEQGGTVVGWIYVYVTHSP